MSRFIINSVQFDADDVITVTYMDKQEALRIRGAVFQSQAVSVAPDAGPLYRELVGLKNELADFLDSIVALYRDDPAFVPENEPDEDEDEGERGMGW